DDRGPDQEARPAADGRGPAVRDQRLDGAIVRYPAQPIGGIVPGAGRDVPGECLCHGGSILGFGGWDGGEVLEREAAATAARTLVCRSRIRVTTRHRWASLRLWLAIGSTPVNEFI